MKAEQRRLAMRKARIALGEVMEALREKYELTAAERIYLLAVEAQEIASACMETEREARQ